MSLFGALLSQKGDDYLVFLVRGDSISAGAGDGSASPDATVGTLFEYDNTAGALVDRATTEFSSASVGFGSPWKQMGINLNAATGKRIVFICAGLSGAEVHPNGGTGTHWNPYVDDAGTATPGKNGSTLYTSSVTKVTNCLALLGKTSLDGICDIVGINDARGAVALSTIDSSFTGFYDATNIDFPGVPIYATSIGRDESNTVEERKATIKRFQRVLSDNRSYYHLVCNLVTLYPMGLYRADDLHPNQLGNNLIGELYARYIIYSESNKQVKQVWNSFKDDLSTAHKAAWKTWVEQLQSDGIWDELEAFIPAIGTTRANVFPDVRYLGFAADAGFTFNANVSIRCSSTTVYRRLHILPQYSWIGAGQTDFIVGTKVKTNYTAAGTGAYLFGVVTPPTTRQILLAQVASNQLGYIATDNTSRTYAGHTSFQGNTLYSVYRTGTTKGLFINGSSVDSFTQASLGHIPLPIFEGLRNNNSTPELPIDAEIEYSFQAKYTGFSMSNFNTATETLLTALRIP